MGNGQLNTPTNDHYTLRIYSTPKTALTSSALSLTFQLTGSIDMKRTAASDLQTANKLFAPALSLVNLNAMAQGFLFDFWELLNWFVFSTYWTILADLGLERPTFYPRRQVSMIPDFTVLPDFRQGTQLPARPPTRFS
jgi:hypothetical protein